MKETFLSRFTPSLMTPNALEALFVQREALAQRIIQLIRDSTLTLSKHHTLLIGPRGIGKTHLVALLYHRIQMMDDLGDKLLIAWLREDEWGVTSFLDLLLRIFRALPMEDSDPALGKRVEEVYDLSSHAAERVGGALLKEVVGNRTLLVLVENMDDLFEGLGDEGQKRLRAYLQESPFCTILATAQSLFNGVSLQTSPFYGFFRIYHLEELNLDEAKGLLANIANFVGDNELRSFIETPTGRARIRAVHHLAGGNHRVYVIFSQFLNRESLDTLAEAFIRTLDDLTPYYQARMMWLSSQQRKIIEFLCNRRGAAPVKEIAQRCFMTHQTASSQLKDLREKGYVRSQSVGRDSFYELREALMRLCIDIKKNRGEPIRLLVDFLRLWYSKEELQKRLEIIRPDDALEREYVLHALQASQEEVEDPRVAACLKDYNTYHKGHDYTQALSVAEELVAIRGYAKDWSEQGHCLAHLGRWDEALTSCAKAIKIDPKYVDAWSNRGWALDELGRFEEAIASLDRLIEQEPNEAPVWYNRGVTLSKLRRYDEALESFDKAIQLDSGEADYSIIRGRTLERLGRLDEALMCFNRLTEVHPDEAEAWFHRALLLGKFGHLDEELASFDRVTQLDPNNETAWFNRGLVLRNLGRDAEALTSFDKGIELSPNEVRAWVVRGATLDTIGRYDEALASLDKAIQLDPNNSHARVHQGMTLNAIRRYDEALVSFSEAIELGDQSSLVFFNHAEAMLAMNQWNEGIAALDNALLRFAHADEPYTGDTSSIIRILFKSTHDTDPWRNRIKTLVDLYDKHEVASALGTGLVQIISEVISPMVSGAAARRWRAMWQEFAGNRAEFEIPLRLLDAAVRYHETHDPRILLELPVEERTLLNPLLGLEESHERERVLPSSRPKRQKVQTRRKSKQKKIPLH